MPRLSIAWAMIAVALVAVGLAAFRAATPLLGTIVFWSTYSLLVVATLAAAVRGRRSPHWVGFAICGWAYFLVNVQLIQPRSQAVARSPIGPAISELAWRTFPRPPFPPTIGLVRSDRVSPTIRYSPPDGPPVSLALQLAVESYNKRVDAAVTIGEAFACLIAASVGAGIAHILDPKGPPRNDSESRPC